MDLSKKVADGQMQTYTGTKTIKAIPTTKKEYCEYRGWDIPEGEDPEEVIYLVEYAVDPKSTPNHKDHAGYITMSPKHVFDEAYKASGTYTERLLTELEDLKDKMEKLEAALIGGMVPKESVEILTRQFAAMKAYYSILFERLENS